MKPVLLSLALILGVTAADESRPHWAFQPLTRPSAPQVDGSHDPIDRFVRTSLEEAELVPSDRASAEVLIRRLCFALCGLPPSPQTVASWTTVLTEAGKPADLAPLVDTLLSSRQFAEHWARHWLDVARYADSTGGDANGIFPHAWRYRDYVVESFHQDNPFDEFLREQIAGDLLPIADEAEWAEHLVATGFLAVGQKLVGEVSDRKFFADLVDEQIDATSRTFMGLTVACARCHDHKSDPISQQDYYGLASIFRNTVTHYGLIKAQSRQFSTLLDVTGMGLPAGRETLDAEALRSLVEERDAASRQMSDVMREIRGGSGVTRGMLRRTRTQRDETENALQSYDARGHPLTFAMGVQARDDLLETPLLERGELDQPRAIIPPHLPRALDQAGLRAEIRPERGNPRLQLANWMADPRHPLTARVMANRVWHWLFGRGLVRTVDDFGTTGEPPSHPELLDHLAIRLVEQGWSIKKLVREIVLSETWQQASTHRGSAHARDPENRLLWRMTPRRLEAEAVRDSLLAVSGRLKLQPPAIPLIASVGEGTVGQAVFEPEIRKIEAPFRSLYLPRVRSVLPELLELYDAPDAGSVRGARETTTVPLQALYLLNAPFAVEQATSFARRIADQPEPQQVPFAFITAFGRGPTASELEKSRAYLTTLKQDADPLEAPARTLLPFAQALLCTAEFTRID